MMKDQRSMRRFAGARRALARCVAVAAVTLASACTPAEVRAFGVVIGADFSDADVAALVELGGRDCVPGRDEPAYVECAVADAARRHGVDLALLDRIAWCESRYDPDARNARSTATGLFQFTAGTWAWAASLGAPHAHEARTHARANADTAAWLIARPQYGGSNHWRACR